MMADPQAAPPPPTPWTVIPTEQQLAAIRFSPCGRILAAGGRDGLIHRWRLDLSNSPEKPPMDVAAAGAKGGAKPTPPALPRLPAIEGHNGWVTSLVFLPAQSWLVSADSWGQIVARPYADDAPKVVWQAAGHEGWVRQLALSPDGRLLASCGRDRRVRLWSAADGQPQGELDAGEDVFSIAFHPDGKSLVSGDFRGVVRHWDLATRQSTREFDCRQMAKLDRLQDVGGVRALAFTDDGATLACGGAVPDGGGFVTGSPAFQLFDWKSGQSRPAPTIGTKQDVYLHELVFHPDGYFLAVCSGQPGNGLVLFLRPDDSPPFFQQKLANCHSVALHPNVRRFAVASNAGTFGQGPSMAREGKYDGNTSPIHVWDLALPPA